MQRLLPFTHECFSIINQQPVMVQDNYDVLGTPTTAGAAAFMDNFPLKDSTMVSCDTVQA